MKERLLNLGLVLVGIAGMLGIGVFLAPYIVGSIAGNGYLWVDTMFNAGYAESIFTYKIIGWSIALTYSFKGFAFFFKLFVLSLISIFQK